MPSIIAATPPRGDHDDGDMSGRPTATPAAHLGGRTVAPSSFSTSPDPCAITLGVWAAGPGGRAATGGPLTRDPPPPYGRAEDPAENAGGLSIEAADTVCALCAQCVYTLLIAKLQ